MTNKLYPLQFQNIHVDKVWGCEDWLLSGLENACSQVRNGFLAGNSLNDILETYLSDLVGEAIYNQWGNVFPLLIKTLTINDFLSVQVHPDDDLAFEYFGCLGKTEMWYILDAKPEAKIYLGFNKDLDATEFLDRCANVTLDEVMNVFHPQPGQCYFIPAGTVHACGGGITIAEVQQSSDITYRIYDWGREHNPATAREMHVEAALECINFKKFTPQITGKNGLLCACPYFACRHKTLHQAVEVEGDAFQSFVLYIGLEGQAQVRYKEQDYLLNPGECMLLPDGLNAWTLGSLPGTTAEVMEVEVKTQPQPQEE